jgi:hypothetical protein
VRLRIAAPGCFPVSVSAQVNAREYHRAVIVRLAAATEPSASRAPVSERDGQAIASARGRSLNLVVRSLADLPDDTFLSVRGVTASGKLRLMHLYRTSTDREILVEVADVEKAALPPGTKTADVLRYTNGTLARTELTRRDVAEMIFRRAFAPERLVVKSRMVKPGRRERRGPIDGG